MEVLLKLTSIWYASQCKPTSIYKQHFDSLPILMPPLLQEKSAKKHFLCSAIFSKIPDDLPEVLTKKTLPYRCFCYIPSGTSFYKKRVHNIKIYLKNCKIWWQTLVLHRLKTVKRSMLDDIKLRLVGYLYPDHLCSSQYPQTKYIVKNIFSARMGLVF